MPHHGPSSWKTVTWLTAVSDRQIAEIQPGARVKVLYVEEMGRKEIQSIEPAAN